MRKATADKYSLHKKYMERYEYKSMIERYNDECRELCHRFETVEEKNKRLQEEEQRLREKNRWEENVKRILSRSKRSGDFHDQNSET